MKSGRSPLYTQELAREGSGIADAPSVGRVRVLACTIVWCDAAFAQMFGYTPEELVGQPTRLLHPTDQGDTEFRSAAFAVIAKGEIFRTELQQRRKDGTLGWYDISVHRSTPDRDEQAGAYIDVSNRRRAWLEALKSEEHYRTLFAAMVEGVCVHAQDGRIVAANPAAERILQLSRDEILGKTPRHPLWQAIREDGAPFPGEEHPASVTLRTGQAVNQRIMGLRARGAPLRWISINSQPVFDVEQTKPSAAIVTFMDITEQRRMTGDLTDARTRLQSILDHVPAMIGYWNRELHCEFANSAYHEWLGFPRQRVVGMPMRELLGAKLYEWIEPYVRQASSGVAQHFEWALLKADGSTGYCNASYLPDFDASGSVRGIFFMGSDVSALRASLEKTRELARHLEEIREEERNNIAQALHEGIAQDLFAAKLLLDYLKARALTGETGDQKVVWRQLGEAIATCMESTRDIANQLRPTAPAHWDITAAIAEHAHRIESVSGFTITVREATPLPALAPAIRSLFFSAAREALTLIIQLAAATIVDITLSAQGNIVTLEVKDDGSGVDAEAADGTRSHEFVRIRGRFEALGGGLNVTHTAQGTRFRAQTPISFV